MSARHDRRPPAGAARPRPVAGVVLTLLAATSCAGPAPLGPLPSEGAAPLSAGGTAELADRWWTAFDDAELDLAVERALEGNLSLAATWERLDEARAVVRRTRAARRLGLDAFAGARRDEESAGADATVLSAGLEASFEVDLWGRLGAAVDADGLRAAASEEDYRAAAIGLSAEVALAWFRLAEARQQLALVRTQLAINETVQVVLENRFAVGQSSSADVLRQRQLAAATREQELVVLARIEVLEHQLAVLGGRAPQALEGEGGTALPGVPPLPNVGLAADLLERRPDVRAARLRLAAADRDLDVAVRERAPRLTLFAGLSTDGARASDLFEDWLTRLVADLAGPLVDGGRRRAEVERSEAARRRLVAEYGAATLEAFREVEDALAGEAYQVARIDSLATQLAIAESTYAQLRFQYLSGAADYIDVLQALRGQQGLERDLLNARLVRVELRVALHRALAGGFATPRDLDRTDGGDARA